MNKDLFSKRLNLLLSQHKPKKIKKVELAQKLYVTPQTVSRWCNNVIIPEKETIIDITNAINSLYGFDPDSPECFRWEYLAGQDIYRTNGDVSSLVEFSLKRRKMHRQFNEDFLPLLLSYMKENGYDISQIHSIRYFQDFVRISLLQAIDHYFEEVNPGTIALDDEEESVIEGGENCEE